MRLPGHAAAGRRHDLAQPPVQELAADGGETGPVQEVARSSSGPREVGGRARGGSGRRRRRDSSPPIAGTHRPNHISKPASHERVLGGRHLEHRQTSARRASTRAASASEAAEIGEVAQRVPADDAVDRTRSRTGAPARRPGRPGRGGDGPTACRPRGRSPPLGSPRRATRAARSPVPQARSRTTEPAGRPSASTVRARQRRSSPKVMTRLTRS